MSALRLTLLIIGGILILVGVGAGVFALMANQNQPVPPNVDNPAAFKLGRVLGSLCCCGGVFAVPGLIMVGASFFVKSDDERPTRRRRRPARDEDDDYDDRDDITRRRDRD